MHHALQIEEILADIFYHCSPPNLHFYHSDKPDPVLAALARTCRAFKEPALDALWMSLPNIAPLVQWLPDVSCKVSQTVQYSFTRPLSNFECDILQSYARRIRCIRLFRDELDEQTLKLLSNRPMTDSLFPSLRYLNCVLTQSTMFFWRFPLPSLISLRMGFEDSTSFQPFVDSFAVSAPNVSTLCIGVEYYTDELTAKSDFLCRWQDLRSVTLRWILLHRDSIEHLSRMPALTTLSLKLSITPPAFDSPLSFPNLVTLDSTSTHLHSLTRFLSYAQLPAITRLNITISECPAMQELPSFWDSLLRSNAGHTIEHLILTQFDGAPSTERNNHLRLEGLRPCMAFKRLLIFELVLEYDICLSDSDLLTLASAWPNLEHFGINMDCGWNSEYGITPGGLVRLLEACPRLGWVTLRLDTRGYTEVSPIESPSISGRTFPTDVFINVLDSTIEDESVLAIATFFTGLAIGYAPGSDPFLCYWDFFFLDYSPDSAEHCSRWSDVNDRINEVIFGVDTSPCEASDSEESGEY